MDLTPPVRVWDRFVRLFHWALVASFAGAYLSTESIGWVHKGLGYGSLALVLARVVWGFKGRDHARFANFIPGPRKLAGYLGALLRGREPRHLGHNPAGAMMILVLLLMVAVIGTSGWMLTLDAFWGNGLVETVHVLAVDATLLAVLVHVSANIYASLKHRENLVWSMVTGRKRGLSRTEAAATNALHTAVSKTSAAPNTAPIAPAPATAPRHTP